MTEKLHIHFNSSESGSIFEISQDLIKPLSESFNLTIDWKDEIPLKENRQILLSHFVRPDVVNDPAFDSFEYKILIQPIDGTVLVPEAIECINKYDLIITPANASKNILEKNGVIKPVVVIHNYYKTDLFEKEIYNSVLDEIPSDKIVFYHESTFHPRKGIELLYEGFIKAFSDTAAADKVCLVVKDLPYNTHSLLRIEELKKQTIKLQKKYKHPVTIYKYSCFLEEQELKQLWNRADIYVSMAKIEGFGIPMLRMHLLNKPIICLKNENSGYMDFLNQNNSYIIPTIQHTAKDEFMWLYSENTEWAIPNISDVILTFRQCLNEYLSNIYKSARKECYPGASIGMSDNLETKLKKFSFNTISELYIKTIKENYNNFKNQNSRNAN